jgi:hypothetical protein
MTTILIGKRAALSNWIRQFVTVVDFEKGMYKIQESLFGIFNWGTFKPLPKINYVLVFRSFFAKCEACTMDEFEDNPNSYFQVSLVYNKNRRIVFHETKNINEAFEFAQKIASGIKTRIKDSATNSRVAKWL